MIYFIFALLNMFLSSYNMNNISATIISLSIITYAAYINLSLFMTEEHNLIKYSYMTNFTDMCLLFFVLLSYLAAIILDKIYKNHNWLVEIINRNTIIKIKQSKIKLIVPEKYSIYKSIIDWLCNNFNMDIIFFLYFTSRIISFIIIIVHLSTQILFYDKWNQSFREYFAIDRFIIICTLINLIPLLYKSIKTIALFTYKYLFLVIYDILISFNRVVCEIINHFNENKIKRE